MEQKNFFEVVKIEKDNDTSMQFSTDHLEVALGKYNVTLGHVELNMWGYGEDQFGHKFIATILSKNQ